MIKNRTGLAQTAFGLITLGISAGIAAPAIAQGPSALQIRSMRRIGSGVQVTVANTTGQTRAGVVASKVVVKGAARTILTPVTAAAGQSVTIDVKLPAPTVDDPVTGVVVDDGVPF